MLCCGPRHFRQDHTHANETASRCKIKALLLLNTKVRISYEAPKYEITLSVWLNGGSYIQQEGLAAVGWVTRSDRVGGWATATRASARSGVAVVRRAGAITGRYNVM